MMDRYDFLVKLEKEEWEDALDFKEFYTYSDMNLAVESVAEEAAQEYYHEHDGWEWMKPDRPTTVLVKRVSDGEVRVVDVELEFVPSFYCNVRRAPNDHSVPSDE